MAWLLTGDKLFMLDWWFWSSPDTWVNMPQYGTMTYYSWQKCNHLKWSGHVTWCAVLGQLTDFRNVNIIPCMLYIYSVQQVRQHEGSIIAVINDIRQTFITSEITCLSGEHVDLPFMGDFNDSKQLHDHMLLNDGSLWGLLINRIILCRIAIAYVMNQHWVR